MRSSSLANNPLALTRELDGRYDVVLQVRDNLDLIEQVAGIDFEAIIAELEAAQDFTGITVVQGETVAWDAVNKILTVPKGDKGDKGDTGLTGPQGLRGIQGPQGIKGDTGLKGDTGSQGPKGFDGATGAQGPKGDTGDDLTITQITYNGNGTFNWLFSDGTTYVTPDLKGPKGDEGEQGVKGDQGISVHHLKGTSTTNPAGDFGTSPFRDTYTFYGDADETLNLGWFVVTNGVSDGMSAAVYDTNVNGIVDNSERLGGELPNHYVNVSTNQTIAGTKTFTNSVVVNTISIGEHAVSWNTDESTLDVVLNGATLQVGQEQLIRVTNHSGVVINNGMVVMATGTLGNSGRITVAKANLTNANARMILGVVTETIASGADGFVTAFGKVRGIQTNGANYGETWVDGDVLYVKDSGNGALTKIVPTNTQVKLPVAIVISSHATNGTMFVRVNSIDENHAKAELALKADAATVTAGLATKINNSEKGVANGVATLDVNGKVTLTQIPDSVLGQLEYMGTWNFTTLPTATQKGQYWIASTSGNGYVVGDWSVWNGTAFDKVDNTDAVATVAGRTGNVVLTKSDVGLANVDNTSDSAKPVSTAQQTALNLKANLASPVFTGNVTGLGVATGTSFNSITGLATVAPLVAGTATVGTSTLAARQDHIHPVQTTITGNAGTATTLQTARTINGVSFNGSANIVVPNDTTIIEW